MIKIVHLWVLFVLGVNEHAPNLKPDGSILTLGQPWSKSDGLTPEDALVTTDISQHRVRVSTSTKGALDNQSTIRDPNVHAQQCTSIVPMEPGSQLDVDMTDVSERFQNEEEVVDPSSYNLEMERGRTTAPPPSKAVKPSGLTEAPRARQPTVGSGLTRTPPPLPTEQETVTSAPQNIERYPPTVQGLRLTCNLSVNGKVLNAVIDTGATRSVLATNEARLLRINTSPKSFMIHGLGKTTAKAITSRVNMLIQPIATSAAATSLLVPVPIVRKFIVASIPVQAIIGADVITAMRICIEAGPTHWRAIVGDFIVASTNVRNTDIYRWTNSSRGQDPSTIDENHEGIFIMAMEQRTTNTTAIEGQLTIPQLPIRGAESHQRAVDRLLQRYQLQLTAPTTEDGIPSLPARLPPSRGMLDARITLKPGAKPRAFQPYTLSPDHSVAMRKFLDLALSRGLIQRATGAQYTSPCFFVTKKSIQPGGPSRLRLVVNYKYLNERVDDEVYPSPRIQPILNAVARYGRYITTLDLASAFHQILVHESSRHLTTFTTTYGSFQWLSLPMGLKIASQTLQRCLDQLFQEILLRKPGRLSVYADDLIVATETFDEHLELLAEVFRILTAEQLYLNWKKCKFVQQETTVLGFKLSYQSIRICPSKIEIVMSWPPPTNKVQVQRFTGLTNWLSGHIHDWSAIMAPIRQCIHGVMAPKDPIVWTEECQHAFIKIKGIIAEDSALRPPDLQRPYLIRCDASINGIGAVLLQLAAPIQNPTDEKKLRVIAYASRALNSAETRYAPYDLELLAILFSLEKWSEFFIATATVNVEVVDQPKIGVAPHHSTAALDPEDEKCHCNIIQSDHRPLSYLQRQLTMSKRQARAAAILSLYSLRVQYLPGPLQLEADALSRAHELWQDKENGHPKYCNARSPIDDNLFPGEERISVDVSPILDIPQDQPRVREVQASTLLLASANRGDTPDMFASVLLLDPDPSSLIDDSTQGAQSMTPSMSSWLQQETPQFTRAYKNDMRLSEIFQALTTNNDLAPKYSTVYQVDKDGLMWFINFENTLSTKRLLIVPKDRTLRMKILTAFHDSFTSGHPGGRKMFEDLARVFHWSGGSLQRDCAVFVKECDTCMRMKGTIASRAFLKPLPIASGRLEKIHIDFLTKFPEDDEGYSQVMSIIDSFSGVAMFIPLKTKATAEDVSAALMERWILVWGYPTSIVSDRDSKFTSTLWTEFAQSIGTQLRFTTASRAQANGRVERCQQTFLVALRCHLSHDRTQWRRLVPYIQWAYNSSFQSSVGTSPMNILTGCLPLKRQYSDLGIIPYDEARDMIKSEFIKHQQLLALDALHSLINAQERMTQLDQRSRRGKVFNQGDLVLVSKTVVTAPKDRLSYGFKFQDAFHGPFKIIKAYDNNTVRMDWADSGIRAHPVINQCWLKRYNKPKRFQTRPVYHWSPHVHKYKVNLDKVVDHMMFGEDPATYRFLCEWKGYSKYQATWESLTALVTDNEVDVPPLERYLKSKRLWTRLNERLMSVRGALKTKAVSRATVKKGIPLEKQRRPKPNPSAQPRRSHRRTKQDLEPSSAD